MTTAPAFSGVEMLGIVKSFGGTRVLSGVDFTLAAGRVHALAGENGAGKSTLLKILGGLYRADSGTIRVNGSPVNFGSPRDALQAGVTMIHQELTPLRDMMVYENLFLGIEPGRYGFIGARTMIERSGALLDEVGLGVDPRVRARDLTTAQLQLLEIVKAVAVRKAAIVLMDEPTSSLNSAEIERFYALVRRLRSSGVAIAFTTHKMDELYAIADEVSVLRDGTLVATEPAAALDENRLIRLMVGRELGRMFVTRDVAPAAGRDVAPVLTVTGLSRDGDFENVDLRVAPGEIVGFAGLLGSGRSEFLETLFGLRRASRGTVAIDGQPVQIRSPRDAVRHGLAFVGEDRKRSGIVPELGVAENLTLAALGRFTRRGFVAARAERAAARTIVADLAIKTSSLGQSIATLSGGNQQKAVLGKWLVRRPLPIVYLLVEPTRGVDVGAKATIYELLRRIASEGAAILFVSGELPELLSLSDRIVVMRKGQIAGTFEHADFSQEAIMQMAAKSDAA